MDESTLFVTLFFCVVGNVTMLTVAHQHINDSMQQKKTGLHIGVRVCTIVWERLTGFLVNEKR